MPLPQLLNLAGIVFVAVSLIVVGDTAGKLLTTAGVEPTVVAWSRFGIGAMLVLPFSGLNFREIPSLLNWRVLLRAVLITGGISSILVALQTEPIANVFGAFFIGPIVSYILAVVFLGERPTRVRSILLAMGFFGVMLVVKPGFGATKGIAFALLAGCFYGSYLAMTKALAGEFRPRLLLISQLLIGALILTPVGMVSTLPEVTLNIGWLISVSAIGSAAGNYLLVIANRRAEASLIAPLVYTQLISATVFGVLIFGDWPDLFALVGLVIIASSGLGSLALTRPR